MNLIKQHFAELKKYPQKILILVGMILMLTGAYTADENVKLPIHIVNYSPILYLGLVIAFLGIILYFRKIFLK